MNKERTYLNHEFVHSDDTASESDVEGSISLKNGISRTKDGKFVDVYICCYDAVFPPHFYDANYIVQLKHWYCRKLSLQEDFFYLLILVSKSYSVGDIYMSLITSLSKLHHKTTSSSNLLHLTQREKMTNHTCTTFWVCVVKDSG